LVAAPSKLRRPVGDRVKTDAKDALHLAGLLKLGEIVQVTIPSVSQETSRDLVRAREDARSDLMSARHRLAKLLLRQHPPQPNVEGGERPFEVQVGRTSMMVLCISKTPG